MKKKVGIGLIAAITLVLFYFLFWPASPKPIGAFLAPKAPAYVSNNLLQEVKRFGDGNCLGPEDIAIDDHGYIYAGMADGRIMRLEKDGHNAEVFVDTEGRPSGMAFDAVGNLIVADSERGLLSVASDKTINVLTNAADGLPIRLANDLDIAEDGMIYFSDYRYYPDNVSDFMDGRPLARLLAYDPHARTTRVLVNDLYAANGVTLGPEDTYILVNEMTAYRVRRYWLTGPKQGQTDIFIENLPGYPDNITFNGKDMYWIALFVPRSSAMEYLQARPTLRGIMKPIPLLLTTAVTNSQRYGFILGLNVDGKVLHSLQDPSGKYTSHITSVYEHEGMLFLGNIDDTAIYQMSVP